MANSPGPVRREPGRILVFTIAILFMVLLAIVILGISRGPVQPPSPVRSEQPGK